jgi:hypothetical protein
MFAPVSLFLDGAQIGAWNAGTRRRQPMPNVLMVFPRFNQHSFWNLQAVCDTYGSRAQSPPLGLMTVAALLPADWNIRLVDRNADVLDDDDLAWADMMMTGGMLPQRVDTLKLIEIARQHGKPVVVGGPDPTSVPEVYEGANFRVLGEAEGVIGAFVAAWNAGVRSGRFEEEKFKVDVTGTPAPRFDLIEFKRYSYMGVQFSRGCPFNCEFCDIIELYGRVPRSKTNEQMLAELEALYRAGYRGHQLRRRQPDRQQEGAEALPAGARSLAEGARLPVRVLDRSLHEPRRRRAASEDAARRQLLRRVHRHREP